MVENAALPAACCDFPTLNELLVAGSPAFRLSLMRFSCLTPTMPRYNLLTMKTNIFLARHGQTAWNKEKVFRGSVDVPLNEQGMAEAEAVGKALQGEPVSFVYASPLSRAVQTAQPLAEKKGLRVVVHPGIKDMNFGAWERRKLADIEREQPRLFREWMERPHKCRIPGAETLGQVQKRALDAWREIAEKHPGETGLLVSHRVVCKLLVLGLMGLGPEKFWDIQQDTAAISLFAVEDGRAVVCRINDTCHLAGLGEGRVTADF